GGDQCIGFVIGQRISTRLRARSMTAREKAGTELRQCLIELGSRSQLCCRSGCDFSEKSRINFHHRRPLYWFEWPYRYTVAFCRSHAVQHAHASDGCFAYLLAGDELIQVVWQGSPGFGTRVLSSSLSFDPVFGLWARFTK